MAGRSVCSEVAIEADGDFREGFVAHGISKKIGMIDERGIEAAEYFPGRVKEISRLNDRAPQNGVAIGREQVLVAVVEKHGGIEAQALGVLILSVDRADEHIAIAGLAPGAGGADNQQITLGPFRG